MNFTRTTLQHAAQALASLTLATALGCGSGYHLKPGQVLGTIPSATKLYSLDAANHRLLQYTPDLSNSAAVSRSISLPTDLTPNLIATDPAGRIYVGGFTTNEQLTEVLVYAPGLTTETLLRTVLLEPGKLTALAADASGQIYAGQLNYLGSVKVYSATASGSSAAIRVIAPSYMRYVNDIAIDTAGNVYISLYNGGVYLIDTWNPGATTAARALISPANSYFGGIAVDDKGDIFAMEKLTIVEFAPNASGSPLPIWQLNLPGLDAPYTSEQYSNVLRRDASGNYFVPMTMNNATTAENRVYAFTPAQSGDAYPILEFTAKEATVSTPLGINIALTVF